MIKSGYFYNAFEDDAIVLSRLLGYKLFQDTNSNWKSGFHVNAIDTVLDTMDVHSVNYLVVDEGIIRQKRLSDDNKFREYVFFVAKPEKTTTKNSKKTDPNRIVARVGSTVEIQYIESGEIEVFEIVPSYAEVRYMGMGGSYYGNKTETTLISSADPSGGSISDTSPLGKAIIGRAPGESSYFVLPSGKKLEIKIIKIENKETNDL